jgi:hypothetical protein
MKKISHALHQRVQLIVRPSSIIIIIIIGDVAAGCIQLPAA